MLRKTHSQTNLLRSNRMWNSSASRRNRMLNKVIIITSYAIICVSRHRGYQDNTRITVPPPGHHTHVWPLPLLITSDTYKSNAAPLRETRDGREEQWFITIVSFWCSSSTVWRILYIQLLWTFIEHSGRSDPPLRAAYLRCINVTRSKRLWLSSTGPEMILDPHDAMTRTRGPAPGCLHSAGREQGSELVTDIWLQTLYSATYSSHQSALTKLQPRC